MTNEKDRAMVRRFATRNKRRFAGIDDERKAGWLNDLELVRSTARDIIAKGGELYPSDEGGVWDTKLDAGKVLASAVKTELMMEGMNQADEHHDAKAEAAANQPAPGVTVNVGIVNAPQVRALAMDPAKFDQFAALAESIQTGGTGNSNNGAATPNGTGTH